MSSRLAPLPVERPGFAFCVGLSQSADLEAAGSSSRSSLTVSQSDLPASSILPTLRNLFTMQTGNPDGPARVITGSKNIVSDPIPDVTGKPDASAGVEKF